MCLREPPKSPAPPTLGPRALISERENPSSNLAQGAPLYQQSEPRDFQAAGKDPRKKDTRMEEEGAKEYNMAHSNPELASPDSDLDIESLQEAI